MDPELRELLNTTVVVSTGGPTHSLYGTESWSGSGSTYDARYVEKRVEVRRGDGQVVAAHGTVWIDSTVALSTECRILVRQKGRAYPVVAVETYPDEAGLSHSRALLGF